MGLFSKKIKFEDLQKEDITEIKKDPRSKEAIGGITEFYKVACKKCSKKLTLYIPKMLVMRKSKIEVWVDKNICDDCKKFLV